MRIEAKVVGLPELEARLQQLGARAGDIIEIALRTGALEIQNAAKALVPRKTSTLMRSITVETVAKSTSSAEVQVGPSAAYGKYVEFGTGIYAEGGGGRQTPWRFKTADGRWVTTRGMRARPFMRPAFDETREAALQVIADVLRDQLEAL
jgi:HK97 gp10 family phage protein